MAIITNDGRVGNGEKKTRQGRGKNTKFGTKGSKRYYVKKYRGQGRNG